MIVIYLRRKKSTKRIPKIKDDWHPQKSPDTHYADLETDSMLQEILQIGIPRNDYYSTCRAENTYLWNVFIKRIFT